MDETPKTIVVTSGGFDPLHVGHVECLEQAARLGPLVVGLNSDAWLVRKKGKAFMPFTERAKILLSLRCVYNVDPIDDEDDTACDIIRRVCRQWPETTVIFVKGGDRMPDNTPEVKLLSEFKNLRIAFGFGAKIQSSSKLIAQSKA